MPRLVQKTVPKLEIFSPPKVMAVVLMLITFAIGMTFMLAFLGGLTKIILSKGLSI